MHRITVQALAAAIMAAMSVPALAQKAGDCQPFGRMPNYVAENPAQPRNHDAHEFRVAKPDGDHEGQVVAGRACRQVYTIRDGARMASDLEIQNNYLSQMKGAGQKLYADDRNIFARMKQGERETWLHVYSQENEIQVTVIERQPFKPTLTAPSGADHRLFGHMPNYNGRAERRNFDRFTLRIQDGDDAKDIEVQGAKHAVVYEPRKGATHSSNYDVHENYRHAIEQLGGQVLYRDDRHMAARAEVKGQTIWLHVYAQENELQLTVIEEKAFEASIKPPQASALKTALDRDGRVALYVNFDFARSALKPDAAPVISEVVKLMRDNPSLRLSVDGHTDDIGGRDFNLKLSQARAAAVVAAVMGQGVAADRLRSQGFGMDKPVADNATGDGRARNRRVELVK